MFRLACIAVFMGLTSTSPLLSSLSGQTTLRLTAPNGLPIAGAHLQRAASSETLGMTDGNGVWRGKCPAGVVRASAIGHVSDTVRLTCGETTALTLAEDVVMLSGASVIGGLASSSVRKMSPIRTQVISGAALQATVADDAVEALDFTNGIRETVGCGVCGTQDIHINGLEGVYTLVLLDGVPLLGGLASAYALDGLPLSMVQQVEVIQGPASARFGSQSVGGVINVVLEPVANARRAFRLRQDVHGRLVTSATWGSRNRQWQFGADGQRFTRRIDDNGDGMTDAPNIERLVLTARHHHNGNRPTTFLLRGLGERRFGGQLDFEESDRGGDQQYGERIDLLRLEGIFSQTPSRPFRLTGGFAVHRQESTYGLTDFNATEWISNVDWLWRGVDWAQNQRLRGGLSVLWDFYRDDTPVASDMNWALPALFLEQSGQTHQLSWLLGLRAEQPLDFIPGSELPTSPILAPRLNVKWALRPNLDARINAGRGYRRIHLFTEEHAALDGSRQVRVDGTLRPEQSWNANGSLNWTFGGSRGVGEMDAHAFWTQFTDQLFADYNAVPDVVLYRNIPGRGRTRGLGAEASGTWPGGLKLTLGGTWMRADIEEEGTRRTIEFAPRWMANADVAKSAGPWAFNLQGQTIGPMRLPAVADLPLYSTPYALLHVSAGRTFGTHTLRLGFKNLTNTRQPHPLIAPEAPFSAAFDASRIYGPIEGRRAFVEWQVAF